MQLLCPAYSVLLLFPTEALDHSELAMAVYLSLLRWVSLPSSTQRHQFNIWYIKMFIYFYSSSFLGRTKTKDLSSHSVWLPKQKDVWSSSHYHSSLRSSQRLGTTVPEGHETPVVSSTYVLIEQASVTLSTESKCIVHSPDPPVIIGSLFHPVFHLACCELTAYTCSFHHCSRRAI